MYVLRPYQQQAVNAVYDYLRNKDGNPCVVLPTNEISAAGT
jgi:superfamily II DNA or RNA helicase